MYRLDRGTTRGGGVAIYCQEIRNVPGCKVLWLQVQLSYIKPMLIGCCYRLPNVYNVLRQYI
jgi:hypothetical protein